MNWGKSIILAFGMFGAFIATLVTVCIRQDVNLVTREYYKEELAYQQQIDRMAHAATLVEKPVIEARDGNIVTITYSDFHRIQKGELQLFRPSDPDMDKEFNVQKSDYKIQYFSTEGLARGMYRARLRWTMGGQEFFIEQIIRL